MATPTDMVVTDVSFAPNAAWEAHPIVDTEKVWYHSIIGLKSSEYSMADDGAGFTQGSFRISRGNVDNVDDGLDAIGWEGNILLPATASAQSAAPGTLVGCTGTITSTAQEVGVAADLSNNNFVGTKLSRQSAISGWIWVHVTAVAQATGN